MKLKEKFLAIIHWIILREGGKISVTKILALIATICGLIVSFQGILLTNGVAVPVALLPWFKMAGIIGAFLALLRVRNQQQIPGVSPLAPVEPVAKDDPPKK